MVWHLCSVLSSLSLLFFVTAHGRTMQTNIYGDNVASPNTSLLDSTSSSTTDPNDVEGLITLINSFPTLTGEYFPLFSKDPCYPRNLIWIECSNDSIHRVTALYLSSQSLMGSLPDFSSMDALETIDLHQNFLSGPIPGFIGTFPKLTSLDLSNNLFDGPVPDSVANNKKIKLNLASNPMLCSSSNACSPPIPTQFPLPTTTIENQFSPPAGSQFPFGGTDGGLSGGGGSGDNGLSIFDHSHTGRKKKSKLPVVLGGTIPPSFLTIAGGAVYAIHHRRKRNAASITDIAIADVAAGNVPKYDLPR